MLNRLGSHMYWNNSWVHNHNNKNFFNKTLFFENIFTFLVSENIFSFFFLINKKSFFKKITFFKNFFLKKKQKKNKKKTKKKQKGIILPDYGLLNIIIIFYLTVLYFFILNWNKKNLLKKKLFSRLNFLEFFGKKRKVIILKEVYLWSITTCIFFFKKYLLFCVKEKK